MVQTRTEPAGAGFCRNCYIRNGPKTEPLLTLAIDQLGSHTKKPYLSTDYVYYEASRHKKISKISPTKVLKRPIYRFFIDYNNRYYPLRCMLDLGSTSFVISPNAAKAYRIPVVKRTKKVKSKDVTG